jgi:hypothetical protein
MYPSHRLPGLELGANWSVYLPKGLRREAAPKGWQQNAAWQPLQTSYFQEVYCGVGYLEIWQLFSAAGSST